MLCEKCNTDVPLDAWSDYDQMCENCTYIEHREIQEDAAREFVRQARETLEDVTEADIEARWSLPTLSAAALEAFAAATKADHHWVDGEVQAYSELPEDRHAAAKHFLNLAKLVLLGAPAVVLDHQVNVARRRCGL